MFTGLPLTVTLTWAQGKKKKERKEKKNHEIIRQKLSWLFKVSYPVKLGPEELELAEPDVEGTGPQLAIWMPHHNDVNGPTQRRRVHLLVQRVHARESSLHVVHPSILKACGGGSKRQRKRMMIFKSVVPFHKKSLFLIRINLQATNSKMQREVTRGEATRRREGQVNSRKGSASRESVAMNKEKNRKETPSAWNQERRKEEEEVKQKKN